MFCGANGVWYYKRCNYEIESLRITIGNMILELSIS